MKKQLLFVAAFVAASFASAQNSVVFDSWIPEGSTSYDLTSNRTEGIFTFGASADKKITIDLNSAKFDNGVTYTTRAKLGGKSDKSGARVITIDCPSAGTAIIGVRTGSNSATDRNLVGTFNGTEVYNDIVKEANATTEDYTTDAGEPATRNIYPLIKINIESAGSLVLTAPIGSLNFYYLAFDNNTVGISSTATAKAIVATEYYTIAGVRVDAPVKGINLVKNIMEDGSVEVVKTIVK